MVRLALITFLNPHLGIELLQSYSTYRLARQVCIFAPSPTPLTKTILDLS